MDSKPEAETPRSEQASSTPRVVPEGETGTERLSRGAHRTLLYVYVVAIIILVVYLIALTVANTRVVTVSWVFGSSDISLIWLVVVPAILGLFLGMLIGALLRYRTRRPRA
jgi:uncharacterized integral membrane protein